MRNFLIPVGLLLTMATSGQSNIRDTTLRRGLEDVTGKTDNASLHTIANTSFTAAGGERFLRFEMVVNHSIADTWKMIATEEVIKRWMAPVAALNLRTGGALKTNYNEAAKIDDKGTITLGIINYIPAEIITYKITLNELFAEKCRREDKNLQHIIQLTALGPHTTKITSTMAGWGQGSEWEEAYSFFEKGNTWTFEKLLKAFQ